jgi:hypothetical protein
MYKLVTNLALSAPYSKDPEKQGESLYGEGAADSWQCNPRQQSACDYVTQKGQGLTRYPIRPEIA